MRVTTCAVLVPFAFLPGSPPDIAPNPVHREGLTLAPRSSTAVAMRAELVEIELLPQLARVKATFEMENTGAAEALEVGFPTAARPHKTPLAEGRREVNFFQDSGTIYAFRAAVDGKAVTPTSKSLDRKKLSAAEQKKVEHWHWLCWPMEFAKGQKRTVVVSYEVETDDFWYVDPSPLGAREVTYVLKTGKGWKDRIGSARIVLTFAKGLSADHVEKATPEPKTRGKDRIEWLLEDFEPDRDVFVRYRLYQDAKAAIAALAPRIGKGEDDLQLEIDWAQNHESIGDFATAAAMYEKLAHNEGPDKYSRLRFRHSGVGIAVYEYEAARCHGKSGNAAKRREWATKGLDRVAKPLANLERREKRLREYQKKQLAALRAMREELKGWVE